MSENLALEAEKIIDEYLQKRQIGYAKSMIRTKKLKKLNKVNTDRKPIQVKNRNLSLALNLSLLIITCMICFLLYQIF